MKSAVTEAAQIRIAGTEEFGKGNRFQVKHET